MAKILLVWVILLLTYPAVAGPYDDGKAAYERRDYAIALRIWRPIADQGDADAQYGLVVKTIRKSPRQMAESRAARARARVLSV
jgi:TPR repeat protein